MPSLKKILCILLLVTLIFLMVSCCCGSEKVLCAAEIVENHVSFSDDNVIVDLPPNAAITKIYAYIIESNMEPFNRGEIAISSDGFVTFEFLFYFDKDITTSSASYETTFVQPVLVGPEGAQVKLTAIGNSGGAIAGLILNVAYCPDYCTNAAMY